MQSQIKFLTEELEKLSHEVKMQDALVRSLVISNNNLIMNQTIVETACQEFVEHKKLTEAKLLSQDTSITKLCEMFTDLISRLREDN